MLTLLWMALLGCNEQPPVDTDPTPVVEPPVPQGFVTGQFCLVRTVFEVSCVTGCHSALVPAGGLDLQTDPYNAMVNRPSQAGSGPLVTPNDSSASFVYRKMRGILANGEGAVMPPAGLLDPYVVDLVGEWIDAGAPNDCVIPAPGGEPPPPPPPPPPPDPDPNVDPGPYHPPGWAGGGVHGPAANLQQGGDCRSCHGAQLDGGTNGQPSCDSCHDPGWRTNCTFCHGGTINASGAPPKDIDGEDDPNLISFTSHTAHIDAGYGCIQCHYKPTDYLTNGHVFGDVTPGYGEIDYTQGLSAYATYANGTCSNAYCHGSGRADDGTATDGGGPYGCSDCHPNQADTGLWNQMSGRHQLHLNENITCSECHGYTVDAGGQIIDPTLHVNGDKDTYSAELQIVGTSCNGTCHGFNHNNRTW